MRQIIKYLCLCAAVIIQLLLQSPCVMAKDFVLVIDAGHGGKDYGALGKKAREKDINLAVALELGKRVEKECKDVKVVYTRDNDTFVSLQGRANIANKAHGNLFISIHSNSASLKNKNRTRLSGAATYILGLHRSDENFDVAKRENSVMELEEDYSVTYQGFDPNSEESYIIFEYSQNKHLEQSISLASMIQENFESIGRKNIGVRQDGFWVLAKTSMPAVLVELDFICNPVQEKYLSSSEGQKEMADAIYRAFVLYKDSAIAYADNKSVTAKKSKKSKKKDETKSEKKVSKNKKYYKVQFLTSERKLSMRSSFFKGLDIEKISIYKDDGLYKYTYGETNDKSEALELLTKVKKTHSEAFLVEFKDGKRIK